MRRRSLLKQIVALPAAAAVGACAKSKSQAVEPQAPASPPALPKQPIVDDVTGRQRRWPVKSLPAYTKEEAADLAVLPAKPHLIDFLRHRFLLAQHLFYSARWAMEQKLPEPIVLATLCHDLGQTLARPDHAYWSAALVGPYVTEEAAWAIQYHQHCRFFADESVNYKGPPEFYKKYFGPEMKVDPHITEGYNHARNHKWYMSARLVTMADQETPEPKALYVDSKHPKLDPEIFTDIIGRNFNMPKEGLGGDNTPASHMWRTLIHPTRLL